MNNSLELLTTREFNGVTLDCYVEPEQQDKGDFWATREQIGRLLGYSKPRKAIKDIHLRNKERLDKFSKTVELRTLFNGAQNETPFRNSPIATVYNFRGLLEIYRYSNQPVANQVMDKLWEIADEIRRTGMYLTDKAVDAFKDDPEAFGHLLERYVKEREKSRELQAQIDGERAFTNLGRIVMSLPGAVTFKDAAGFLSQHGIPTGQNRLYKKCREKKLLCSREGRQKNKPTQRSIDKGLFNVELSGGFNAITVITPRGLNYLLRMLAEENYPMIMEMEGV